MNQQSQSCYRADVNYWKALALGKTQLENQPRFNAPMEARKVKHIPVKPSNLLPSCDREIYIITIETPIPDVFPMHAATGQYSSYKPSRRDHD